MRILHTGDWHVGRTIRGRSRHDEHGAVLAELVDVAQTEAVDLVLVAGDQFDHAAPSPAAERLVYRTLLDLAETGATVIVVAGNHDNPNRLAAVAPLLAAAGVTVQPRLARPDDGGLRRLEVAGEPLRLVTVPFVSRRGIVKADDLMQLDAAAHQGRYTERVRQVLTALCAGFADDAVNLVTGHLMVFGGTTGGSERSAHTVFEYAVPAAAFPAGTHYVALGHLHRQQRVEAPAPVWYAGSPLQLDFGEEGEHKGVLLVTAEPGRPARVEQRSLTSGRRLRTVRGSLSQLEAMIGTTGRDHLRVVVEGEAVAGLAEQIRGWFPEVVDVTIDRPARRGGDRAVNRGLARPPGVLFREYLSDRGAADDRVAALFDEVLEEVHATDQG